MAIVHTHPQDGTIARSISALAAGAAVGCATEHLTRSLWALCIVLNALLKTELADIDYHDLYNSTIEYT